MPCSDSDRSNALDANPLSLMSCGAPLRCCLRRSEPGERIALVSYAPLRRWAAE
ncbi:DUF1203 domain-containing protein, partial [Streptomyces sp. NPDC000994]